MRGSLLALFCFLVFTPGLPGQQFWNQKPVAQWTREETYEFFRGSPWVHEVTVFSAVRDPAATPGDVERERQMGPASPEGLKVEPRFVPGERERATTYYIQWTSAKILRQAGAHFRALEGRGQEEPNPLALDKYFITVLGRDLLAFDGATEVELQQATRLRLRGTGGKIKPSEVRIERGASGHIDAIVYGFPREVDGKPVIPDEEQSVVFVCKTEHVKLKTCFKLTEMTTKLGPDF